MNTKECEKIVKYMDLDYRLKNVEHESDGNFNYN